MDLPLERPSFDDGKQGLYNPRNEHDACGVGFVVDIKNRKSHDIVANGLKVLVNLTHRGAVRGPAPATAAARQNAKGALSKGAFSWSSWQERRRIRGR